MLSAMHHWSPAVRQYLVITGNYWAFTLTDGALRMLVVLYFHQLGYAPLDIALLFLFYELFGVITNLLGGWLGARLGLNKTMNLGLGLQVLALLMLTVEQASLTPLYVMAAQALSGIAKDLNKMSAKSAIKLLVPKDASSQLFKWVALLTGSKNTLKGLGFFLGGLLLTLLGFQLALFVMATTLALVWILSLILLKQDLGKSKFKPKFKDLFSKSHNINSLSAARLCLFASRDVWFVVALPVYLSSQFGWDHWWVGGFMAAWVVVYGMTQAIGPKITAIKARPSQTTNSSYEAKVNHWASLLAGIPFLIMIGVAFTPWPLLSVLIGLLVYGLVFAMNSALHSFLIVHYADADGVSLDVGFYYMANAAGRLIGTILSGLIFQLYGLEACLLLSGLLVFLTLVFSNRLRPEINNEKPL